MKEDVAWVARGPVDGSCIAALLRLCIPMPGGLTPAGQYILWRIRLLAALLDKRPDELFGVGFKDAVDFVEEIIHALRGVRGLCLRCCRWRLRYVHFGLGFP
ncbi:hypothetical protein ARTHRO9V_130305 [Arthrobacter sp. 9V]|nr:hypothetical protein ARTHRO9V_130305 [Arthrobacter sp. 9V]